MDNTFFSDPNTLTNLECQFENIIQTINESLKITPTANRRCLKDVQDNCKVQLSRIQHLIFKNQCNHEYITDTIDITPEKSQEITYCVLCESMK
jgi:hypothetical protein